MLIFYIKMSQNVFMQKSGNPKNLLNDIPKTRDPTKSVRSRITNPPLNPQTPVQQSKENLKLQPNMIRLQNRLSLQKIEIIRQKSPSIKSIPRDKGGQYSVDPPICNNQPSLKASLQKIQTIKNILQSLNKLYKIIRSNNQQIYCKIYNSPSYIKENHNYVLRNDQLNRLYEGLSFYKRKIYNYKDSLDILKSILVVHDFTSLVARVCKHYDLDELKAFYLVKQIHKKHKIITEPQSFFVSVKNTSQIIKQSQILKQCEVFLLQDKKHLLHTYLQIYKNQSPSKHKVIYRSQQYIILRINFQIILTQNNTQLRHLFIHLFQFFWQKSPQIQRQYSSQLNTIRKRLIEMIDIKSNYRSRLYNLNIDEDLISNCIRYEMLQLPYKYLHYTLAKKDDLYVERAFQYGYLPNLSAKWGPYIQQYLKTIQFNKNLEDKQVRSLNLIKAVYIYNILKSHKSSKGKISLYLLQHLQKLVLSYCSIILSIIIVSQFQIETRYNYYMTTIINKYHESQFQSKINSQIPILSYLHGLSQITTKAVGQIELSIVKRLMKNYIKMDDVQGLERELMSFGVKNGYRFNFQQQQQQQNKMIKFNCIKYYNNMLDKMPSIHLQIHRDGMQILKDLKLKNHNIKLSLQDFINNIISRTQNAELIQENIIILPYLSSNQIFIVSVINKWLTKIQRQNMTSEIVNYDKILTVICQRLVESQCKDYFNTINHAIRLFDGKISNTLISNDETQRSRLCLIYISFRRVGQWGLKFEQIQLKKVKKLIKNMEQYLFKENVRNEIILSEEIDTLAKLYLYSQFTKCSNGPGIYQNNGDEAIRRAVGQIQVVKIKQIPLLIDTLFSLLLSQKNIFQLVVTVTINHLYSHLKEISKISEFNLIKILKIAIQIAKKCEQAQGLTKVETHFITLTHLYTLRKFKDQKIIEINLYSIILQLLSVCRWMIGYEYHMHWLKMGLTQGLLSKMIIQDERDFCNYPHFIIGTAIAKNIRKKLVLKNEQGRVFDLNFYLQLFHVMISRLLNLNWPILFEQEFETKKNNNRVDPSFMLEANMKLITFFDVQILKLQSSQKDLVIPYLDNLCQHLNKVIMDNPFLLQYLQQYLITIQRQLKQDYKLSKEIENTLKVQIKIQYRYKDSKKWNQQMNKSLWQLVNNSQQLQKHYLNGYENIMKLIAYNPKYKIKNILVTQSILNYAIRYKDQKYAEYFLNTLKLANFVIKNKQPGSNYKDLKYLFPFIFQPFLPFLTTIKITPFQMILAINYILDSWNYILRSNMISAFSFSRKLKMIQNIKSYIKEIMSLLAQWQIMSSNILTQMNKKVVKIDFQWKFMEKYRLFNRENLVQYYQKLIMIRSMLILMKLHNGLIKEGEDHHKFKTCLIQFLKLITVKRKEIENAGSVEVRNSKRDVRWYESGVGTNKADIENCVYEIVYHLYGAFKQFSYQQTLRLGQWQKEMYIGR